MQNPGKYVILTAVSENFWEEYITFYESVRRITDLKIVVATLELNDDQKQEITDQINVYRIGFKPKDFDLFKKFGGHWRQWFKPFYIQKCIDLLDPETILWVDCDTILLQPLDPLLQATEEDFLVICDYFAPETTINDGKLYEKYDCQVDELWKEKATLNSGVIGIKPNRDQHIIDLWVDKIHILLNDQEARGWVKLFDQGALLWAMRELDILRLIKTADKEPGTKAWNYPAKRNVYEKESSSVWCGENDQIGGDLIGNIALDNPDAVIAHYAGLPKLSHLCELNHKQSVVALQHKPNPPQMRLFCVGLERCGTHSFAEILRRTTYVESWIRHEHNPSLSKEAFDKFGKDEFDPTNLAHKLKLYNRKDCKLICESNHRLGFFIEEIDQSVENAKFVVLLRNPLSLLESRLMNYTTWDGFLDHYPGFYQLEMYGLRQKFPEGSGEQNYHRIRPHDYLQTDIIDLHIWELIRTIDIIFNKLRELPPERYEVLWLEDITRWWRNLSHFVGPLYLRISDIQKHSQIKYGKRLKSKKATEEWASELVVQNRIKILSAFFGVLRKHGIDRDMDQF